MKKTTVNPTRLIWCCKNYEIDVLQLSEKVNISEKTLKAAFEKKTALSINQLKKIANFFNRSMLFFLNPNEVQEENIYSVQFRTINNQRPIHSPKLRALLEQVEKQRMIYKGLLEDLDEVIKTNWYPNNLLLDKNNLKKTASNIRHWLKIKPTTTFEELRLAIENKEVMIFVSNAYNGKWQIPKQNPVRGFSLYYNSLPIIVIKKQSKGAQAFTMFHELAHLLLHKNSTIDYEEDFHYNKGLEKEANEIAGNVLIPDEFLKQIDIKLLIQTDVKLCDNFLSEFTAKWCVSSEAILVRLVKERKISNSYYDNYKRYKINLLNQQEFDIQNEQIEKKKIPRKYRYREPINIFGKPFVTTVLDAFHNQHITLAKTSTYLDNLKIKDVHKLAEYLV